MLVQNNIKYISLGLTEKNIILNIVLFPVHMIKFYDFLNSFRIAFLRTINDDSKRSYKTHCEDHKSIIILKLRGITYI